MTMLKQTLAEWDYGYFNNNGVCTKCNASCLTWSNASECTSCSNRFLNATTKLWELCPDGQFYSDSLVTCLDWNGSCQGQWAYQLKCFNCAASAAQNLMLFSLKSMKCVSQWSATEVQIKHSQLRDLSLCRELDYYVDPDGSEIIELGTKKYPFK